MRLWFFALRAEAYHQFRKAQRHLRLYGVPLPTQRGLEDQALALPAGTAQTAPARRLSVLPRKTAGQYQDE